MALHFTGCEKHHLTRAESGCSTCSFIADLEARLARASAVPAEPRAPSRMTDAALVAWLEGVCEVAKATCFTCRAYARVWSTGAQHVDGWPVLVTWATRDGERTMVESTGAAARPLSCRSCGSSDPRAVIIHSQDVGEGPLNAGATGKHLTPAVSADVSKAPLERPAPPRRQLDLL